MGMTRYRKGKCWYCKKPVNRLTGKKYLSEEAFLDRITKVESRWPLGPFKWTNDPRNSS